MSLGGILLCVTGIDKQGLSINFFNVEILESQCQKTDIFIVKSCRF
jgi:hypothetical protein